MMKSYIYTGPLSGASLKGHGDFLLIPGATVQLPAGHGYTERLIRKGWLQEVVNENEQPDPAADFEQVTDKKRRK